MKMILIFALCGMLLCAVLLCSCGTDYDKAETIKEQSAGGYFTTTKEWDDSEYFYRIVYANDTKVKYLMVNGYRRFGITPLYNADGSLQVYDGE